MGERCKYLWSHGIVIFRSSERTAETRDFSTSLINSNDVSERREKTNSSTDEEESAEHLPRLNFLFRQCFDHLLTEIVDRFHFRCFQRHLADLRALKNQSVTGTHRRLQRISPTVPVAGRSIWISTTSPSMNSASSLKTTGSDSFQELVTHGSRWITWFEHRLTDEMIASRLRFYSSPERRSHCLTWR